MERLDDKKTRAARPIADLYSPERLLDVVIGRLGLRFDKELAERLRMQTSHICRIRSRKLPVGATLLIRIQEETGMSLKEIKAVLGDRRARYRNGSK